jgi:hypothetical protein
MILETARPARAWGVRADARGRDRRAGTGQRFGRADPAVELRAL